MPLSPGDVLNSGVVEQIIGGPPPPPASPSAPSTLGNSPSVASAPSPGQGVSLTSAGTLPVSASATGIRMLTSDPASPSVGEIWYRSDVDKLSIQTSAGVKRTVAFT